MAWIDALLRKMVEEGASDLHMTSKMEPRLRLHGDLEAQEEWGVIHPDRMKEVLLEIAPDRNREEWERDNDTDFAYEIEGCGRFRVNLFVDHKGPGGVFRHIPSDVLTATDLGLPKAVVDFCYLSKGLVVVTGPTGSGKSTTLAAMIDHINKHRADHILTIEDPVEFVHKDQRCLINQREVGRHTNTFKRALRAALREDPDIVLVGEMRDLETIEIAIETAETGHLVFGTLHTTTAASTVDRIIDQFPADRQAQIRTMLSTSLKGVVAQTLCKKKPKGRVAALEILVVTNAVSAQIREGKTYQIVNSMQMGGKVGMRLLNDSLAEHVQNGLVDPMEAYVKAVDKDDMLQKLARLGVALDPALLGDGAPAAGANAAAHMPPPTPSNPYAQPIAPSSVAGQRYAPAPVHSPQPPNAPFPGQVTGAPPRREPRPGQAPADDFEAFKKRRGY